MIKFYMKLIARLLVLGIPTVCAMDGYTIAGGLFVALAFDFRFVGEGVKIYLPEVDL